MTNEDTLRLVELASDGDESALAELMQLYRERLRRMVVLRMDARVRARFSPSDVVQEAYVEIARRIASANRDSNIPFFLWMRMVTGDQLADLHRKHLGAEKRTAAREVGMMAHAAPDASSVCLAEQLAGQFTSADRGLKREEVRIRLETALNKMDDNDREVIAMRHFEELTTDEIATVLKLTRSGVLKRYTRAIRRLSEAINSNSDTSFS